MPHKDPEKRKEYMKKWHQKNKEKNREYCREYYQTHKEEQNKKNKEYCQTHTEERKEYLKKNNQRPEVKKADRIRHWIKQGILFHDYDLLHDKYISTTHCDFCKCLLNQCGSSRKCVDHNHDIHDNENVRGILCNSCNRRGVLD